MHLSQQTDYACRVLIYLALNSEERVSVKSVSEAYDISLNHLVKVVHQLGKLGYVLTTRGRGGGIRLAREPEAINLGELIRQMEPNFTIVECFNRERNHCPIAGICGLEVALGDALEKFFRHLDQLSLADVLHGKSSLKRALKIHS